MKSLIFVAFLITQFSLLVPKGYLIAPESHSHNTEVHCDTPSAFVSGCDPHDHHDGSMEESHSKNDHSEGALAFSHSHTHRHSPEEPEHSHGHQHTTSIVSGAIYFSPSHQFNIRFSSTNLNYSDWTEGSNKDAFKISPFRPPIS